MWQPIETAPKGGNFDEGPLILLGGCAGDLSDDFPDVYLGFWGRQSGSQDNSPYQWCDWGIGHDADDGWQQVEEPTCWAPIPRRS